jgi:PEGA domain
MNFHSIACATFALALLSVCTSHATHAQAAAETAGATAVAGATAASAKSPAIPAMPSAGNPSNSQHLTITAGPPPEVINRQNLEKHAGTDAAKLLVRSTPSGSHVWIDGAFVGNTPMLLIVAPGKYHVDLRGPRQETGSRIVDLLPRETREIASTLTPHYPTRVVIR